MSAPFLLVTGFGSFEDVSANPSGALARLLDRRPDVVGVELPVSFARAPGALDEALAGLPAPPAGILSLGVHPDSGFRLERYARPDLTADRVDVDGGVGAALGWTGPVLETGLDLDGLAARLTAAGAECSISADAGRYVCECVYRHGLIRAAELGVPGLFLHVPPLEMQALDAQLPAVELVVQAVLAGV